jgi:predicted Kef-type K+ transport protein
MYRNKFQKVCFTVSVSVSMNGQKQILTDLPLYILSPAMCLLIGRAVAYALRLNIIWRSRNQHKIMWPIVCSGLSDLSFDSVKFEAALSLW